MAAITHESYMDESGTHDGSPLTLVGGYLFDAKSAARFQQVWAQVLKPYRDRGIEWFHAYSCANKEKNFANLNFAERLSLFRQLVDLTRDTAYMGFVVELESSVYDAWRVDNPTVNSLVGSKYAACCFQSLLFLRQLLKRERLDIGDIHYFFERIGQENGKGNPLDRERNELLAVVEAHPGLVKDFRFGAETRAPKGQVHALESADLMLWTYSSLHAPLTDFTKVSRRLFREGLRHRCTTMSYGALTEIARLNNDFQIRENSYVGKVTVFKF